MSSPKPGTKVRSSQTGRPIMAILDLLGRRWSLRILWELHQNGPNSFRTLQKLCSDVSPTVLNTRLKEMREAGIVELRDGEGYFITETGVLLGKIINQLNMWAKNWAEQKAMIEKPQSKKVCPKVKIREI
jgi:DNA-binding HxlR family transcriptional regulator